MRKKIYFFLFQQKTLDAGLRQENLISRLKGLQQQLTDIRASLNMPEMPKTTFIGSQLKKVSIFQMFKICMYL